MRMKAAAKTGREYKASYIKEHVPLAYLLFCQILQRQEDETRREERASLNDKTVSHFSDEFSARQVETEDGESRREDRESLIKKPVPLMKEDESCCKDKASLNEKPVSHSSNEYSGKVETKDGENKREDKTCHIKKPIHSC
eukprot:11741688-Ditylum_brightwellii.AAC.1